MGPPPWAIGGNRVSANDRQIAGSHYASKYQHWDFVLDTGMDYLAGCASKYVSRHRKKGGLVDLEKSLHYVDKLIENHEAIIKVRPLRPVLDAFVNRFVDSNKLTELEHAVIMGLTCWTRELDLQNVKTGIQLLIKECVPYDH